jgi:hypothetical protein
MWIPRLFVTVAVTAWLLTFLGMARRMLYAVLLGLQQQRPHMPHLQHPGGQAVVGAWQTGVITPGGVKQ